MSLEERRAERRRKRQMEEESGADSGGGSCGGLSAEDLEAAELRLCLEQRRREREDRRTLVASSVVQVNGEDDLERRRRERREQRLRSAGGSTATEDTSSRRDRRRRNRDDDEDTAAVSSFATEEPEDTPDTSSFRARPQQNWDEEEEKPTVNDTSAADDSAAQEEQRRREEQEEAESRRQAEAAAEEERRREAKRREEEEDRRREEEQERRREDQKRREHESVNELRTVENTQIEYGHNEGDRDEDDSEGKIASVLDTDREEVNNNKLDRLRKWTQGDSEQIYDVEQELQKLKIQEDVDVHTGKVKDKLDRFEHFKVEGDTRKSSSTKILERNSSTLQERLTKYKKEVQVHTAETKDPDRHRPGARESPSAVSGGGRLQAKVRQYEGQTRTSSTPRPTRSLQRQDSSASTSQDLADRWKRVVDTPTTKPHSRALRSPSQNKKDPEILSKRLSGNTESVALKYLQQSRKSHEAVSPSITSLLSYTSDRQSVYQNGGKASSVSSETLSDYSDKLSDRLSYHEPVSVSKVAERWPYPVADTTSPAKPISTLSWGIHSRESSMDNSAAHSRRSSFDASSDTSHEPKSPAFWKNSQSEQEEEARLEAERVEEERVQKEEGERMAADEEKKKKKGKRKGLGGLSPEKKKKLKQIIMQKAAEEMKKEALAKAEAKEKYIAKRMTTLAIDGIKDAELKELCKQLHKKVSLLESDVYDCELKIANQDQEVQELTIKVNDSSGKFVKPVLRKVNKTERKFAKLQHAKEKADFRENLKSSGQSKFDMDDEQQEQAAE